MVLSRSHINDKTSLFAQTFVSQIDHEHSGDKIMVIDLDLSEVSNHQGC